MIAAHCQRWRDRRGTYRPANEPFDPQGYEVAPIDTDREARGFVEAHHYSGTYPVAPPPPEAADVLVAVRWPHSSTCTCGGCRG